METNEVVGTGGGKFGAPARWVRPDHAKQGTIVWGARVAVAGIGPANRGRRESATIEMVVGAHPEAGWVWFVSSNASGRFERRDGSAATEVEAKTAAIAAAKSISEWLASRPRESAQHPPIGPAIWPCV